MTTAPAVRRPVRIGRREAFVTVAALQSVGRSRSAADSTINTCLARRFAGRVVRGRRRTRAALDSHIVHGTGPSPLILVIDNYDSFVHNLARYLTRLGQTTNVVRNDAMTVDDVQTWQPEAIVLSPGPGIPADAGRCLEVVERFAGRIPMLGVCLGHQILAQAFGGRIVRSVEPVHGRFSRVTHTGDGYFRGLPNPLQVGRYHSLVVEPHTLPACLRALAQTADGVLMAFEHVEFPILGVQFHPESVLTEGGYALLSLFLKRAGLSSSNRPPAAENFRFHPTSPASRWPFDPITF